VAVVDMEVEVAVNVVCDSTDSDDDEEAAVDAAWTTALADAVDATWTTALADAVDDVAALVAMEDEGEDEPVPQNVISKLTLSA